MPEQKKSVSSKKRRIIASPETVRERSQHTLDKSKKPRRGGKVRSALAWPFHKLGSFFRRLNTIKGFRWIGYVIYPIYIRNSLREVRLVDWPNGKQTRQLTTAVIVFAVIFGVLVALVDYVLDHLFRKFILKQ